MSELKYFKHCDLESKTVKEFLETSDVKLLLNDLNNFFDLIQMPGGYTFYFHILGYGDKPKHIAVRIVRLMYGNSKPHSYSKDEIIDPTHYQFMKYQKAYLGEIYLSGISQIESTMLSDRTAEL